MLFRSDAFLKITMGEGVKLSAAKKSEPAAASAPEKTETPQQETAPAETENEQPADAAETKEGGEA